MPITMFTSCSNNKWSANFAMRTGTSVPCGKKRWGIGFTKFAGVGLEKRPTYEWNTLFHSIRTYLWKRLSAAAEIINTPLQYAPPVYYRITTPLLILLYTERFLYTIYLLPYHATQYCSDYFIKRYTYFH